MEIINEFCTADLAFADRFLCLNRYGSEAAFETELLTEHTLDVRFGERLMFQITCTPEYLAELVLGRLLTEGIICSTHDVDRIILSKSGCSAEVSLKGTSADTGDLKPLLLHSWEMSEMFLCAERFAGDTVLHVRTRSAHSCFLVSDGRIIFECEDISRHNAVDKAIGWALLQRIDLSASALFTTGRVPKDMALKMVHARVPVLISKESATAEAVKIARCFGLTIIGRVKSDSFVVYCDGSGQPVVKTTA